MKIFFAPLVLALAAGPALAVELNFAPPVQDRGASFAFAASMSTLLDGSRVLTVTSGPWESFLDRVAPQHTRAALAAFGFLDLRAADDWSVDFDGSSLTLRSPLNVRPSDYSDLVVLLAYDPTRSAPPVVNLPVTPVPEPETYALMLAGLGLMRFWSRRVAGAQRL